MFSAVSSVTARFNKRTGTKANGGSKLITSARRTVAGRKTASERSSSRTVSATADNWYGPNRNLYLPDYEPPAYLDGTMAGDHGYDPLGVGGDPKLLEIFRKGEVINGRFAMLGTVGMIMPEILAANGVDIKGASWLVTGKEMLNGGTLDYAAMPFGVFHNPLDLTTVLILNSLLVFGAEFYRLWGKFPDGTEPADELYPGFDPLNLAADPEAFEIRKVNEVRNGRLAMMGFLGFAVQGYVTGEGPYANLTKHIADPNGYNILTELAK